MANSVDMALRIVLYDEARQGLSGLSGVLRDLNSSVGAATSSWAGFFNIQNQIRAVNAISTVAFLGFAAALGFSVVEGAKLTEALAVMQNNIQGASDAMGPLQAQILHIADNSTFTAEEVTQAFSAIGQHAYTASDILNSTLGQSAIDLAEAINVQTVPAANLLTSTMRAFGASASEAGVYASELTSLFHDGVPSVSQMQQALDQTAGTAAAAGVSFSDLGPVIDLLNRSMQSGSQTGTALKDMLQKLLNPSASAQKAMTDLGLITLNTTVPAFGQLVEALGASGKAGKAASSSYDGTITSLNKMFTEAVKIGALHTDKTFYEWATSVGILKDQVYNANGDFIGFQNAILKVGTAINQLPPDERVAYLTQLFTMRGEKGAEILFQNLAKTKEQLAELNKIWKNTQLAQQDAAVATNTVTGAFAELKTTFLSVFQIAGEQVAPYLITLFHAINTFLGAIVDAKSPIIQLAGPFLLIGTAVFGVLALVTRLILSFKAIVTASSILTGSLGFVAVVMTIAMMVFTHWSEISAYLAKNFGWLGSLLQQIGSLIGGIVSEAVQEVIRFFENWRSTMSFLVGPINALMAALSWLGETIMGGVYVALTWIRDQLKAVGDVTGPLSEGLHGLVGMFQVLAGHINAALGPVIQHVIASLSSFASTVIPPLLDALGKLAAFVGGYLIQAWNTMQGVFSNPDGLWQGVTHAVSSAFTAIKQAVGPVVAIVLGLASSMFAPAVWTPIMSVVGPVLGFLVTGFRYIVAVLQLVAVGVINFVANFGPTLRLIATYVRAFATVAFGAVRSAFSTAWTFISGINWGTIVSIFRTIIMVITSLDPVVLVTAAVIGMIIAIIVGMVFAVRNWGAVIHNMMLVVGAIFMAAWSQIKPLGALLMHELSDAWKQVQQAIKQLEPTWNQFMQAINNARPFLMMIAGVIGGIIVTSIGILIGAIVGIVHAIGPFLSAVITIIAGVIQAFMGLVMFFLSVGQLFYDIFHGNWSRIGQDFQNMWNGLVTYFGGIWKIIQGVIGGGFETIKALVSGFIQGFIGFFAHLQDVLVGHSIVPDMINAIIKWIASLPEKAFAFILHLVTGIINFFLTLEMKVLSAVTSLVMNILNTLLHLEVVAIQYVLLMVSMLFNLFNTLSGGVLGRVAGMVNGLLSHFSSLPGKIVSALSGLGNLLFSSGQNAMQMFANGISSMVNTVLGPIANVAGKIAGFLAHHSPAAMGPLSDDDTWMGNMMKMHAASILNHVPLLQSAAHHAAMAVHTGFSSPSVNAMHRAYSQSASGTHGSHGSTTLNFNVEGKTMASAVIDNLSGQISLNNVRASFR